MKDNHILGTNTEQPIGRRPAAQHRTLPSLIPPESLLHIRDNCHICKIKKAVTDNTVIASAAQVRPPRQRKAGGRGSKHYPHSPLPCGCHAHRRDLHRPSMALSGPCQGPNKRSRVKGLGIIAHITLVQHRDCAQGSCVSSVLTSV